MNPEVKRRLFMQSASLYDTYIHVVGVYLTRLFNLMINLMVHLKYEQDLFFIDLYKGSEWIN